MGNNEPVGAVASRLSHVNSFLPDSFSDNRQTWGVDADEYRERDRPGNKKLKRINMNIRLRVPGYHFSRYSTRTLSSKNCWINI